MELIKLFKPESIAIVGVSRNTISFGGMSFLIRIMESGFKGRIYPVNPKADEIRGLKAYPDLISIPEVPDLAIVCVPARHVPAVLEECAGIGLRHIHILTAGFREIATREGIELENQVADIAAENNLRIMGPNCMGPYCPSAGLTAWGAIPGKNGPLGIISQSGGITQRLTEYAYTLGIGTARAASIGNATVLGITEFLQSMAEDEDIKVIAIYLENLQNGRELFRIACEVNQQKPVIIIKGGKSGAGASTVASHTGSMAGKLELWEAFVRQTGVIHVQSIDEWMDAILAFCCLGKPGGKGVFLASGGGGNSVLNADMCVSAGLDVPSISESGMELLRKIVPAAGSIAGNPLDLWETFFDPSRLTEILDIAGMEDGIHMIVSDRLIPRMAYHMPEMPDQTDQTIEAVKAGKYRKPMVFTIDYEGGDTDLAQKGADLIARFCNAGIPAYPSVQRAARALVHLYRYYARFS